MNLDFYRTCPFFATLIPAPARAAKQRASPARGALVAGGLDDAGWVSGTAGLAGGPAGAVTPGVLITGTVAGAFSPVVERTCSLPAPLPEPPEDACPPEAGCVGTTAVAASDEGPEPLSGETALQDPPRASSMRTAPVSRVTCPSFTSFTESVARSRPSAPGWRVPPVFTALREADSAGK